MAEAGTVSVPVEAQTDGVPEAIQQAIDSVTGDVQVEVEAVTDSAQAEIDSLTADPITAEVDAATDAAQAEIDALDGGTITEDVEVDTSGAEDSLSSLADQADAAGGGFSGLSGGVSGGSEALDAFAGSALGVTAGLSGMTLGAGAVAAGLGFAVDKASESQQVVTELDQVLQNTGASAYLTETQVTDLGMSIEKYTGFSHDAADSAQTLLLTFGNVGSQAAVNNGIFQRTTELSADVARFMGTDIPAAALALGRAVDNPTQGVNRLRRAHIQLSQAQIDNIQSMQANGDLLGAQQALLDAVGQKVGGVARAYGQTLAGSLDIAKQKMSDNAEEMGQDLIPTLTELTNDLVPATNAVHSYTEGLQHDTVKAGGFWQELFGVIGATRLGAAAHDSKNAVDELGGAVGAAISPTLGLGSAADQASQEVNNFEQEIQAYEQRVFGMTNADDAFARAQHDMIASLAQNGSAIGDNSIAALNNRQALEQLVTATGQRVEQLHNQRAGEVAVAGVQRQGIGVIQEMADRYGWTRAQTERYTNAILHIPGGASTDIVVNGLGGAISGVGTLLSNLRAIDGSSYTANIRALVSEINPFAGGTESAPSGLAWVGEQGPELIALGGGERIWSHPESVEMAAAAPSAGPHGARRGGEVLQPIVIKLNEAELGRALVPLLGKRSGQ